MKIQSQLLKITFFSFLVTHVIATNAVAASYISVEGSLAWQSQNDQAIPGNTGTRISLSDADTGPFGAYRIYLAHQWDQHEIRGLYAPFSISLNPTFNTPIQFMDETFAANTKTEAYYKFNSYRLTYIYHMTPFNEWNWGWGFTAKTRDAEVRLSQPGLEKSKKNVGFVPLLHLQANRNLDENLIFKFDFDGLAAPQGRAFDISFFLERSIYQNSLSAFGGYRTVEGGADNEQVYNFAWFHFATLGLRHDF